MKRIAIVLGPVAVVVAVIAVWTARTPERSSRPPIDLGAQRLTPVLFVHGLGAGPKVWRSMKRCFLDMGYPAEYLHAVDLDPPDGANKAAAEGGIARAVEQLLEDARSLTGRVAPGSPLPDKIDIVAHSMGALSSRWYTARIEPNRVRTWISIAGTNHGSNSVCGWKSEGAEDLCPAFASDVAGSPIQIALNGTPDDPVDESPYGIGADSRPGIRIAPDAERSILYLTIRIEPDRWITPHHSAVLDGAGGLDPDRFSNADFKQTSPGNLLFIGGTGRFFSRVDHDNLLDEPAVAEFVASVLTRTDR